MKYPSISLLERLAEARNIPFSLDRMPRSCFVRAPDGTPLHYLDWDGGPASVVFIHGGALSAHSFDLVAMALGKAARCIAIDLRGHGKSGWADQYSVGQWAADVVGLIGSLDLKHVHLVGMSLGGCVGGHAAPTLGDRLSSLTFVDVADQVNFAASGRMRSFFDSTHTVHEIEDIVAQALAVSRRTDPDLMLYRYQSLLMPTEAGFAWRADRRSPTDFSHILSKLGELAQVAQTIHCPVLIVRGGRGTVLDQTRAEDFAGRFDDGRCAVIEDAGHNIQEDQPAALARQIVRQISISSETDDRSIAGPNRHSAFNKGRIK